MVEAWKEFGKATGVAELHSVALLQSEGEPGVLQAGILPKCLMS
jgi:hypothetical protein